MHQLVVQYLEDGVVLQVTLVDLKGPGLDDVQLGLLLAGQGIANWGRDEGRWPKPDDDEAAP